MVARGLRWGDLPGYRCAFALGGLALGCVRCGDILSSDRLNVLRVRERRDGTTGHLVQHSVTRYGHAARLQFSALALSIIQTLP